LMAATSAPGRAKSAKRIEGATTTFSGILAIPGWLFDAITGRSEDPARQHIGLVQ
jgi:hypothetical protein